MKRVVLIALGLLLASGAASVVALVAPEAGGARWNDRSPQGHSLLVDALASQARVRVLERSLSSLPADAGAGATLFLFPTQRPATAVEVEAVADFVDRGGRLVIAADGAHGAGWAERFGFRFQGLPAHLPPSANTTCLRFDWGDGHACLPSPTAFPQLPQPLHEGASFDQVSNTSDPVFLDLDGDRRLGATDLGPARFPVAFEWRHGRGRVIAVADADLWRNDAASTEPANLDLARAWAQGALVYLDATGQDAGLPGWVQGSLHRALASPDLAQFAAVGLFVAAAAITLALAIRPAPGWRPHAPAEDAADPAVEAEARQLLLKDEIGSKTTQTMVKP